MKIRDQISNMIMKAKNVCSLFWKTEINIEYFFILSTLRIDFCKLLTELYIMFMVKTLHVVGKIFGKQNLRLNLKVTLV
jgi:hypothetical protein